MSGTGDQSQAALSDVLSAIREGDRSAFSHLLPMVYDDLRRRARGIMSAEPGVHTLQPTALVHEAYIRLLESAGQWESEAHFFNAAAAVMRHILVDHAKGKRRQKRGGGRARVDLDDVDAEAASDDGPDLGEVDLALRQLETRDPRRAQVVTLKFFGGLTEQQIGAILGRDERTVRRDWVAARLWLHQAMNADADGPKS